MAMALALAIPCAAGCAQSQPGVNSPTDRRGVPAKCTACHLAPMEHSLPADRWERYLNNHRRRIRLTDQDKAFLHDFLVAPPQPATAGK
jgi:hypothetical protein